MLHLARRALPLAQTRCFSSVNAKESVDKIFVLFQKLGKSDYFGEKVNFEEHALQAAYLGTKAGFPHDAVIAALLHDVGHMVGLELEHTGRMDDCGVADHENIGGDYVRELGFSERVASLVRKHVDAKRYLCCVQEGYHNQLSDVTKITLQHQGGPMTPEEARLFEKNELFKTMLAMRHWDDGAKQKGLAVPDLSNYREMMEEHITKEQSL